MLDSGFVRDFYLKMVSRTIGFPSLLRFLIVSDSRPTCSSPTTAHSFVILADSLWRRRAVMSSWETVTDRIETFLS